VSFYGAHVLPWLIDRGMRSKAIAAERARVVPRAKGIVVEIGVGSGLNLPLYGAAVERVLGVDPSPKLLSMTRRRARAARVPVQAIEASAESVPVASAIADTVVTTWTLCSIAEIGVALAEIRRLLKPGGRLLFIEHGRAPDASVRAWQDRITPLWRHVAGGCHLDRDVPRLLAAGGFRIDDLDASYSDVGPRPFAYLYRGSATSSDRRPAA
jgi:ubiquinone/menaquinone biosynthesis C-methylase UbiE